jgi:hypothetical protein
MYTITADAITIASRMIRIISNLRTIEKTIDIFATIVISVKLFVVNADRRQRTKKIVSFAVIVERPVISCLDIELTMLAIDDEKLFHVRRSLFME